MIHVVTVHVMTMHMPVMSVVGTIMTRARRTVGIAMCCLRGTARSDHGQYTQSHCKREFHDTLLNTIVCLPLAQNYCAPGK